MGSKSDIRLPGDGGDNYFSISLRKRSEEPRRSPWNREYKDVNAKWKGYTYPEVKRATD